MRERIQAIGRTLSSMVMPNIGAFIAWGFFTALFLYPNGWIPNEDLSQVGPFMLAFLLPILIAGTGGRMFGGGRGFVLASTGILGCIAQDFIRFEAEHDQAQINTALAEYGHQVDIPDVNGVIPMLLAAMIVGPLCGLLIKKFDQLVEGRIPAGFEMLVNNFSVGIFAVLVALICFYCVGPINSFLINFLSSWVDFLVNQKLIPLVAVFLEPAKVLFLNNAINHGIFTPLGAADIQETGKSIMYMLEPNPGPGLGVLVAYWLFARDKAARNSAPGAIIIQFFGGIHEIYFPYVLAVPAVIVAPILGNVAAITWFTIMGAGLMGPASPGSIISFIMMSPRDTIWITIVGVIIAAGVSFLVASPIVKKSKGRGLAEAQAKKDQMKASSKGIKEELSDKILPKGQKKPANEVSKVIFACDAGMGSSAMGATKFKKRIADKRPDITCTNFAIDSIPKDADIVVCQTVLAERASQHCPVGCQLVTLENFLGDPVLDELYNQLCSSDVPAENKTKNEVDSNTDYKNVEQEKQTADIKMLKEGIKLGQSAKTKDEAIQASGELLKELGCVDDKYVAAMHDREKEVSTYLGMGVAIPHGTSQAKSNVIKSGVVFLQYPEGVSFGDEKAYLVFGIAGVGNDHLDLLAKISERLEDEEIVEKLKVTDDVDYVYNLFNS